MVHDILICTYGFVQIRHKDATAPGRRMRNMVLHSQLYSELNHNFSVLVVDESQAIKNHQTKLNNSIRSLTFTMRFL